MGAAALHLVRLPDYIRYHALLDEAVLLSSEMARSMGVPLESILSGRKILGRVTPDAQLHDAFHKRGETLRRRVAAAGVLLSWIDERSQGILTFKGPALSSMLFGNHIERDFADIDIFSRTDQVMNVHRSLMDIGFAQVRENLSRTKTQRTRGDDATYKHPRSLNSYNGVIDGEEIEIEVHVHLPFLTPQQSAALFAVGETRDQALQMAVPGRVAHAAAFCIDKFKDVVLGNRLRLHEILDTVAILSGPSADEVGEFAGSVGAEFVVPGLVREVVRLLGGEPAPDRPRAQQWRASVAELVLQEFSSFLGTPSQNAVQFGRLYVDRLRQGDLFDLPKKIYPQAVSRATVEIVSGRIVATISKDIANECKVLLYLCGEDGEVFAGWVAVVGKSGAGWSVANSSGEEVGSVTENHASSVLRLQVDINSQRSAEAVLLLFKIIRIPLNADEFGFDVISEGTLPVGPSEVGG